MLRDFGLSDSDLFKSSPIFRALSDGFDAEGRWESSDSDPVAAAIDIKEKIWDDFGFHTRIEMFNEQRNPIIGECFSGTFFLQRIPN
jgi:hypothetical protein